MPESDNRYRWMFRPLLFIGMMGFLVIISQSAWLDLDFLKSHAVDLITYRLNHPRLTALLYFGLYATMTSLSVPGVIVLSLAGGVLFGMLWGTVLASFASALGGTVAFLVARRWLRDPVQRHCGKQLALLEAGIARDGPFYLFGLRLMPMIPYFLVNLLMGLTQIPTRTFYWVSQLGMLPLLILYVNAGTALARLNSLLDLLSPSLLLALGLLAGFPLLASRVVARLSSRQRVIHQQQPPPTTTQQKLPADSS
jgi:uncharacterized membrane protein YdjX (TVP38/TMEM64 family)